MIEEICNAAGELARFPAPFSSVLPGLFVAGDDTHETHSLAPGVATPAPVDVAEEALCDRGEGQQGSAPSAPRLLADDASLDISTLRSGLRLLLSSRTTRPTRELMGSAFIWNC